MPSISFKFQLVENCHTVTVYKSSGKGDATDTMEWRQNPYLILGKPPSQGYKPPLLPIASKLMINKIH